MHADRATLPCWSTKLNTEQASSFAISPYHSKVTTQGCETGWDVLQAVMREFETGPIHAHKTSTGFERDWQTDDAFKGARAG
jgi:hypothetical protein